MKKPIQIMYGLVFLHDVYMCLLYLVFPDLNKSTVNQTNLDNPLRPNSS